LKEFNHDRYPGTEIPKNFSSRVLLNRPDTGERREVLIYMNNPLRYWGETYYQASFDRDDQGSILQVVRKMAGLISRACWSLGNVVTIPHPRLLPQTELAT
jgi:cytochrome c biogenesis protein ResB